ncbi:coxsackievirus and adenovirus receptor homolog [Seriola lalandi dorsalis]|uniref:coxsackievirus and adenovirus receptor homolog n=1 Tax=Seriola lalandi dorsalis TaxID=1841481 RepID=UPI000C6F5FF6|nr:coxsackievirus and adenovirus receptor homolog [Seriola lalandi dorsalis]
MFSSVLIVSVCLLTCLLPCVSGEETKVKPGENVTLPCRGPRDAEIILIKWNRTDLKSKDYIFFYRDNRIYEEYQLPSYHGRVELTDPQVKDGDASVILKNVTINDAGRYECQVGKNGSRPQVISNITLTVTDAGITEKRGDKEGNSRGRVGLKSLQVGSDGPWVRGEADLTGLQSVQFLEERKMFVMFVLLVNGKKTFHQTRTQVCVRLRHV